MRLTTFIIMAALAASASVAKEPERAEALYECIYAYDINGTNPGSGDFSERYNCILQIGRGSARFLDYTAFCVDSVSALPKADEALLKEYRLREWRNKYYFDQAVYQNLPAGHMTVESVITPDFFSYQEDASPIKWELVEGTDTVCGYECLKAEGEYGGRKWTAWYAPEIPVPFGPWKFTGLPGLVMRAGDSENIHTFSAISLRKGASSYPLSPQRKTVTTTREKFIASKNDFEKVQGDKEKKIPLESVQRIDVYRLDPASKRSAVVINGAMLRQYVNGYTPLELE